MIYIPILLASFLGSLHCVGMCGGFVACYSSQSTKRAHLGHFSYNLGRLISYTILGAIAGLLGAGINSSATLIGIQKASALLAGVILILMGLKLLQNRKAVSTASQSKNWVVEIYRKVLNSKTPLSPSIQALLLGLFSTFLPCGYLFTFVAAAAATGSMFSGVLVMFFFWLGTVPALLGFGYALSLPLGRFAPYAPRIAAVILIVVGSYSVYGHFSHDHSQHSQHQGHHNMHHNHNQHQH